ncbi:Xaa-Pro peptidase family protein [Martelella mangrovi]|uniref:Xaa-Pro dipeptidase n=1 Tax=Martelella mangrovi TaxID=1397477 RepID=A0ABV2IDX2_9HYPH
MFERAEFEARAARARADMERAGVDLLLAASAEFVGWLSGYTISETMFRPCFLPLSGEAWFVIRDLDAAPCRDAVWFDTVEAYDDSDDPVAVTANSIAAHGFGAARIGYDSASYSMTPDLLARLEAALPEASFVAMPGIGDALRWVKSPAEIAVMERAAAIADATMEELAEKLKPGMTVRQATAMAAARMVVEGSDNSRTGPILKSGGNHEFLHGAPQDETLDPGDILHVELTPEYRTYSARMMRPVVFGPPGAQIRHVAERLIALQNAQMAAMKPGVRAGDVDAILRRPLLEEGLRKTFPNVSGYTLGIYGRTPRVSDFSRVLLPGADWPLETGMVFHLYASAQGLGFSETVAVTPDRGRRLTAFPRQLIVVS